MIKCINGADLKNVNLSNKDNFMKSKDMNVGFSTTAAIVDLRKKDLVAKKQIAYFFSDVNTFFISLIEKMIERSPISCSVVRYASIFDRKEIISVDTDLLQSKMKKLLQHFVKLGILSNISCDKPLINLFTLFKMSPLWTCINSNLLIRKING